MVLSVAPINGFILLFIACCNFDDDEEEDVIYTAWCYECSRRLGP